MCVVLGQINTTVFKEVVRGGRVPVFKFVPLLFQLAGRIQARSKQQQQQQQGSGEGGAGQEVTRSFQHTLHALLFSVAKQWPFHVLPTLFALTRSAGGKHSAATGAATASVSSSRGARRSRSASAQSTSPGSAAWNSKCSAATLLLNR